MVGRQKAAFRFYLRHCEDFDREMWATTERPKDVDEGIWGKFVAVRERINDQGAELLEQCRVCIEERLRSELRLASKGRTNRQTHRKDWDARLPVVGKRSKKGRDSQLGLVGVMISFPESLRETWLCCYLSCGLDEVEANARLAAQIRDYSKERLDGPALVDESNKAVLARVALRDSTDFDEVVGICAGVFERCKKHIVEWLMAATETE